MMAKTEQVEGEGIEDVNPHLPIVAEGTGKTAANEGAKEKEVYNVC